MTTNEIEEAVVLLRDENLVWGSELEQIRLELASLLQLSQAYPALHSVAEGLSKRLINPGSNYTLGLETRDA